MALLGLLAVVSEGAKLGQFLHFLDWETVEDINSFSSKQFDVFSDKGDRGNALLNLVSGVWVDQSLVIKSSFKQIINNVHQAATLLKKAYFQSKVGSDSKNLASKDDNVILIAPNNFMTWHLFPVSGNGSGAGGENNSAQQPPQVKKSRRGPRSRSSQYRGVKFYRRTGICESHIWPYDRVAIEFRGVDADINFNLGCYEEDMQQVVVEVGFKWKRLEIPCNTTPLVVVLTEACSVNEPWKQPSFLSIMDSLRPLIKPPTQPVHDDM